MNPQHIANLIIEYRYLVLIPLAIVEGPVVAFVSGTLASLGYFNLYALMILFFARDMAIDAFYYYSGYFYSRTAFAQKMLGKAKIGQNQLTELRLLWERRPARTMLVGKFSYGIARAFLVAAGVVKMNVRKFFTYGAMVAVVQYATILLVGYFFGNAFGGNVVAIIENIQYVIAGAALFISGYYIFRWYLRRKLSQES